MLPHPRGFRSKDYLTLLSDRSLAGHVESISIQSCGVTQPVIRGTYSMPFPQLAGSLSAPLW